MRDLKADLEICEAMSGRRWYVKRRGIHPAIYADDGAPVATVSNSAQSRFPEQRIANAKGIAAAREAWPEAIRRAMEAEARVAELEAERDALVASRERWRTLARLRDKLLVCYRVGKNPGKLLDDLYAAEQAVHKGEGKS